MATSARRTMQWMRRVRGHAEARTRTAAAPPPVFADVYASLPPLDFAWHARLSRLGRLALCVACVCVPGVAAVGGGEGAAAVVIAAAASIAAIMSYVHVADRRGEQFLLMCAAMYAASAALGTVACVRAITSAARLTPSDVEPRMRINSTLLDYLFDESQQRSAALTAGKALFSTVGVICAGLSLACMCALYTVYRTARGRVCTAMKQCSHSRRVAASVDAPPVPRPVLVPLASVSSLTHDGAKPADADLDGHDEALEPGALPPLILVRMPDDSDFLYVRDARRRDAVPPLTGAHTDGAAAAPNATAAADGASLDSDAQRTSAAGVLAQDSVPPASNNSSPDEERGPPVDDATPLASRRRSDSEATMAAALYEVMDVRSASPPAEPRLVRPPSVELPGRPR